MRRKSQSIAPGARSVSLHPTPGVMRTASAASPSRSFPAGRRCPSGWMKPNGPPAAPSLVKSHASAADMSLNDATHTLSSVALSAAPLSATDRAICDPCANSPARNSVSRDARHLSWNSHGSCIAEAVVGENSEMTAAKSWRPMRRAAAVDACVTAASASDSIAPRSTPSSSHARLRITARVLMSCEATTGAGGGVRWSRAPRQNCRRPLRSCGGSAVQSRRAASRRVDAAWNCASVTCECSRMWRHAGRAWGDRLNSRRVASALARSEGRARPCAACSTAVIAPCMSIAIARDPILRLDPRRLYQPMATITRWR